MKLEQQVCSLELAKRLKELGVKQESLWKWFGSKDGKETILSNGGKLPNEYRYDFEELCSTFTVAELGEMLPGNVDGMYFLMQWGLMHNQAFITAMRLQDDTEVTKFGANTEADARAKMLVYLLENKLITL